MGIWCKTFIHTAESGIRLFGWIFPTAHMNEQWWFLRDCADEQARQNPCYSNMQSDIFALCTLVKDRPYNNHLLNIYAYTCANQKKYPTKYHQHHHHHHHDHLRHHHHHHHHHAKSTTCLTISPAKTSNKTPSEHISRVERKTGVSQMVVFPQI